jgi:cytochrome c biogenesis protein CcmG/thiol:disulfide interchange protein DsbE
MWRTIRLIAALSCLAAALWIVLAAGLPERTNGSQSQIAPEVGALAPLIDSRDLAGQPFSLVSLRGQPVILNFWATWCGPCITEMPMLQAAYEVHRHDGLRLIAIDAGEPPQTVLDWKTAQHLTFEFLIDHDGKIASDYQLRGLPSTYFIAPDGQIVYIAYGPLTDHDLDTALSKLLAP